jgi:hypothetical protein
MAEDEVRNVVKEFSTAFTSEHTITDDINTLWNTFKNKCTTIMEERIPSKMTTSRFNQPWINKQVKRLSRRKKKAYKQANLRGSHENLPNFNNLQKDTQRECKQAYNTYVNNLVTSDKNPKKLYSFISSKRCESSGVSVIKDNGVGHSDPKVKAKILNNQFSSVFTREDLTNTPTMDSYPYPSMDPFTVTVNGVTKLLSELDPHKAQGPDGIPPKFLKEFATDIAPALTLVFQASLTQGRVPDEWKHALVTPVFKKGQKYKTENYRTISLTCVSCKIFVATTVAPNSSQ